MTTATDAKAAAGPTDTSIAVAHKQVIKGLDDMRSTLERSLPGSMSVDKFTSVVKTAINTNPDILKADRQSLYNECVRAAQDGLLPDGREAAFVVFGGKVKYMPMIGGLRKKAAQHGFDLIAQVVYENDEFEFQLGDEPKILHVPVPLNQDSGPVVGFYAIATEKETGIKYREVMNKDEVEQVRKTSKSGQNWENWYTEMGRKTVCRRLFKQLPFYTDDDIQKIITDGDDFNLAPSDTAGQPVEAQPTGTKARDKILDQGQAGEPQGGTQDVI